jgi:hypothetical protein
MDALFISGKQARLGSRLGYPQWKPTKSHGKVLKNLDLVTESERGRSKLGTQCTKLKKALLLGADLDLKDTDSSCLLKVCTMVCHAPSMAETKAQIQKSLILSFLDGSDA